MTSHFSILPSEVIRYLSLSLDNELEAVSSKPLRILRLPHPRTGSSALFLPLEWLPPSLHEASKQSSMLLEIQAVSPPDERSWILGEDVVSNGNLLIMTPIDPSFLLLYILQATRSSNPNHAQFRTVDDLFDESVKQMSASEDSSYKASVLESQDILDFCSLSCTLKSLASLCDVKDISSEIIVYRLSAQKSLDYMRAKVSHLEKSAVVDGSRTMIRSFARDGLMEDGKEDLLQLGRTRACCDLVAQYLTPSMRDVLVNSYDFSKLQKYLDTNIQEAIAMNAPSKAKAGSKGTTAAKRKPVKASRGIENLKKVNTTGMAKMSSFFSKA